MRTETLVFRFYNAQVSRILQLIPELMNSVRVKRYEVLANFPDTDVQMTDAVREVLLSRLDSAADEDLIAKLSAPQTIENRLCQGDCLYILNVAVRGNTWTIDLTADPESEHADRRLIVSSREPSIVVSRAEVMVDPDGVNLMDRYDCIVGIDEYADRIVIATSDREFTFRSYSLEIHWF